MTMVFISSVMRGFTEERKAARQSVLALHLQPVMAEDFGSKPHSPKTACLDGVRSSDIYLGIAGPRYGYVTSSGVSVTEEEFAEARQRGLPIIWFVKKGDMEPKQAEFVERISGYEEGYFLTCFEDTQELVLAITRALNSIVGQPGIEVLNPSAASEVTGNYLEQVKPRQRDDPVAVAVIIPERQGEPYLSALDFSKPGFKEGLLQPGLFGAGAVFDRNLGTADVEGREHLAFEQRDQRDVTIASLHFHIDGGLIWRRCLVPQHDLRNSLVAIHVLDQDELQGHISRFLHYAKWYYGQLADAALISSLYLSVAIFGSGTRQLGHIPDQPIHSISMGFANLEDPLVIPKRPMKVSRSDLNAPEELAGKLVGLLERAYKAAGAYFEPGK